MADEFDSIALLHERYASDGPAWHAAIDYGIDVSLLERNLELTVEQRLEQLFNVSRLRALLAPAEPRDASGSEHS
jgi:hypothetical protein